MNEEYSASGYVTGCLEASVIVLKMIRFYKIGFIRQRKKKGINT